MVALTKSYLQDFRSV